MSARALVIGALNADVLGIVPRFPGPDEAVELAPGVLAPGGHAGNCAVGLARLGVEVRVLGSVGDDPLGEFVLGSLDSAGVDIRFVRRSTSEMTGLAFLPVLEGGARALYVLRGANRLPVERDVAEAAQGCDMVIVFDPDPSSLAAIANGAGRRPQLFSPGGVAATSDTGLLAPMLRGASYLVVNGPEAAALSGTADAEEAAELLSQRWGLCACVTAGAGGCWTAEAGAAAVHCPAFEIEAMDTTGAGDAFTAGFGAGLLEGKTPVSAVARGCAAGALAVRALGAQSSLGSLNEVEALLRTRELSSISR